MAFFTDTDIVSVASAWPATAWQEHQRHGPRRQALLRYIAMAELRSIEAGPPCEYGLWPLVHRDLTAMRIASGRAAVDL